MHVGVEICTTYILYIFKGWQSLLLRVKPGLNPTRTSLLVTSLLLPDVFCQSSTSSYWTLWCLRMKVPRNKIWWGLLRSWMCQCGISHRKIRKVHLAESEDNPTGWQDTMQSIPKPWMESQHPMKIIHPFEFSHPKHTNATFSTGLYWLPLLLTSRADYSHCFIFFNLMFTWSLDVPGKCFTLKYVARQ